MDPILLRIKSILRSCLSNQAYFSSLGLDSASMPLLIQYLLVTEEGQGYGDSLRGYFGHSSSLDCGELEGICPSHRFT